MEVLIGLNRFFFCFFFFCRGIRFSKSSNVLSILTRVAISAILLTRCFSVYTSKLLDYRTVQGFL